MKWYLIIVFAVLCFSSQQCSQDPTKAIHKEEIAKTDSTIILKVWKYEKVELGFDTLRYEMRKDDNTLQEHNPPKIRVKQ